MNNLRIDTHWRESLTGRDWMTCTTDAFFLVKPQDYDPVAEHDLLRVRAPRHSAPGPAAHHQGAVRELRRRGDAVEGYLISYRRCGGRHATPWGSTISKEGDSATTLALCLATDLPARLRGVSQMAHSGNSRRS